MFNCQLTIPPYLCRMSEQACYCGSGKSFGDCCEPIITGQIKAPTALALMRSRYTAFATVNVDYLIKTAHPNIRKDFQKGDLAVWAKENPMQKLEIVSSTLGGEKQERGEVEFKAYYTEPSGHIKVLHENSVFVKEGDQWLYFKGTINPKPINDTGKTGRNAPCPCGSGLKYKKCCG